MAFESARAFSETINKMSILALRTVVTCDVHA